MLSITDMHRAGEVVAQWSRICILTHERPDGDAMGCLIGLASSLLEQGKTVDAYMFGEAPKRYSALVEQGIVGYWSPSEVTELAERYDGLLIADTCARAQLTPVLELLESKALPTLVIDHHVTRDEIADYTLIDATASSASLLVLEWAEALEWPLNAAAVEALFVGMATDTGWYRFSNTDARTLAAAARLLERGVRPDVLYQQIYLNDSEARMRLMGVMLQQMRIYAAGRLAVTTITEEMMTACGATMQDLDDLINESQRIGRVDASILLLERPEGTVKVSLRSKHAVDVARVAEQFGGGGHQRAAGARVPGSVDTVRERLVSIMEGELDDD